MQKNPIEPSSVSENPSKDPRQIVDDSWGLYWNRWRPWKRILVVIILVAVPVSLVFLIYSLLV